jgi:hypothetical protein
MLEINLLTKLNVLYVTVSFSVTTSICFDNHDNSNSFYFNLISAFTKMCRLNIQNVQCNYIQYDNKLKVN